MTYYSYLRLIVLMLSILLIFSNSLGFDMYHHVSAYYFYDVKAERSYNFYDLLSLPRYFFLSYVYGLSSWAGIPIGYTVLTLCLFPWNSIIFSVQKLSEKGRVRNVDIITLALSTVTIFFYSGLSLSLLWLLAYIYTGKRVFLTGAFFHPVGLVLFVILILGLQLRNLKDILIPLVLFFTIFTLETHIFQLSPYSNLEEYSVKFENLKDLLQYADKIQSKTTEIAILILILILPLLRIKVLYRHSFRLDWIFALMCFSIFAVAVYMSYKPSLLFYLSSYNVSNYAVYAAWFDFGLRDLSVDHVEIYNSRYDDYK